MGILVAIICLVCAVRFAALALFVRSEGYAPLWVALEAAFAVMALSGAVMALVS
jgi:hypothetical protein